MIFAGEPPAPKPSAISAKPSSWNAPVIITLRVIEIVQDKNIGKLKKRQISPKMPDIIPITEPIRGKHQAAFVRLGGLLEKLPINRYSCKKHYCSKKI